MNELVLSKMLTIQRGEITEHKFYEKIAKGQKSDHNKKLLNHIAEVEMGHYNFWLQFTKREVKPNFVKVIYYYIMVLIFGLTFGVRLLEKKHRRIKRLYREMNEEMDGIQEIIDDEHAHEKMHIDEIDEERLKDVSSIVLGLNDALVEFTGAIAGFTFALGNTRLVALAGIIAGIAASLSMASSEYLATKQEHTRRFAIISALYTGCAYIVAVAFMILPYLLFTNLYLSLTIMIMVVVLIIYLFNYYISVAKELRFKNRFLEMITISLGVATLSFIIGFFVRRFIGIDI